MITGGTCPNWERAGRAASVEEVAGAAPAGSRPLVPEIVAAGLRRRANSVQQVAGQAANQLAGPALGGLLAAAGVAAAFAASGGVWLVSAGAAVVLRGAFRTPVRTRLRDDVLTGLRLVWSHRVLKSLCLSVGVTNFAAAATMAISVVYAVGPRSAMG